METKHFIFRFCYFCVFSCATPMSYPTSFIFPLICSIISLVLCSFVRYLYVRSISISVCLSVCLSVSRLSLSLSLPGIIPLLCFPCFSESPFHYLLVYIILHNETNVGSKVAELPSILTYVNLYPQEFNCLDLMNDS